MPDDNFEQALINLGYDNVLDDYVLTFNIDALTFLDVSGMNISDLTGIEDFTTLTTLWCNDNYLTSLDVSQNIIEYLICWDNQLTSINLNAQLFFLNCGVNNLVNIDLSQTTALTYLYCGYNQLTSIDVSSATALERLFCHQNQLTSIDVSNNPDLLYLLLYYNNLTSLDVSANTSLTHLDFYECQLTSINLSQNSDLIELRCGINLLTSLDLSQNISLEHLYCQSNQLTSLDLSNNIVLDTLYCVDNQLTTLDLRNGNNINLSVFNATSNPNLNCISVDDHFWSTTNWTVANGNIDPQHYFINNCDGSTSIAVLEDGEKRLLKVVNILGIEVSVLKENQFYFYIYANGTVVKQLNIK